MEKIVEIDSLSYAYGEKDVLKDISLHVNRGEIVAIVGASGSGKTTLFHLIAGVLQQQKGRILIDGSTAIKGKVSYMLQKDLLLEHKTVIDNVVLPLWLKKVPKQQALQEALSLLQRFGLQEVKDKYPSELSGGMRQRIALLRTYLFKKSVFLLDEAFSALDAMTKIKVHEWFLKVHEELGLSTIMITHDLDEAMGLSQRIYVLGDSPARLIKEIQMTDQVKMDPLKRHALKQEVLLQLGL